MAKAKKRTTAQRRAAAKEAWARRRAEAKNVAMHEALHKAVAPLAVEQLPKVDFTSYPPEAAPRRSYSTSTAGATREGDDFFITITVDGSLHRHKLSATAMRKLGLDCLQLVG